MLTSTILNLGNNLAKEMSYSCFSDEGTETQRLNNLPRIYGSWVIRLGM